MFIWVGFATPNSQARAVLPVCRLRLNVRECETRDPASVSVEDIAEHTYEGLTRSILTEQRLELGSFSERCLAKLAVRVRAGHGSITNPVNVCPRFCLILIGRLVLAGVSEGSRQISPLGPCSETFAQ